MQKDAENTDSNVHSLKFNNISFDLFALEQ